MSYLLQKLREAGLTIEYNGEKLLVQPTGLITDEIRAEIRAHRDEIIAALTSPDWLASYQPDWDRGNVQLLDMVKVDVLGRDVVVSRAEWEDFKAWVKAHNAAADERHKKKAKK